jgi:hypothetical protein
VEDAGRILGEYIALGPSDATRTVHRLIAVLDRDEVVLAIDRMKRRGIRRRGEQRALLAPYSYSHRLRDLPLVVSTCSGIPT